MKVIIIGAVAAGMSTAAKLKRNMKDNVEIIVYEKNDEVSFGACGIPFYVSDKIKEASELIAKKAEDFKESGIDIKIFHEVTNVDVKRKVVTILDIQNNITFEDSYDKLVIGSGASVLKFPPFDKEYGNLFVVRNVSDGTKIKQMLKSRESKNVVIIGGGYIGIEMLEACKTYDVNVSLVELSPNILTSFDEDISKTLLAEIERNNIKTYLEYKATELISENNIIKQVKIEKDGNIQLLDCDMVINCAGIRPFTNFISDVDKYKNGAIIVDENMQTNQSDIYSSGDCSIMKSFITGDYLYAPLGTNANKQGRIIADVLSGIKPKPFKLIGSSAIKVFDLDCAKVGISEEEAKKASIPFKTNKISGNSYASYYGKEKMEIKLVYNSETRIILGAQIVGQGVVVQRCNYFAIAINAGLTVDEIGFLDLCYSPPFGGVWDVSLIAANTAK